MEQRFAHDFSAVRVHTDTMAAESTSRVNALAYTVGNRIAFASGQYSPGTPAGDKLLAHELTHIMQQSGASCHGDFEMADQHDARETEAEHIANGIGTKLPQVSQRGLQPILARQPALRPDPPAVSRPPAPGPRLTLIRGGQAEAARELARRSAARQATRTLQRAGWRQFWRAVMRRFAIRGAAALALTVADGPLPVGDLIALGLTLWTIWEIIELWDVLWQAAQQETEREAETNPDAQAMPDAAREGERERRNRCLEQNPGAQICEDPIHETANDRDEILAEFIDGQFRSGRRLSFDDLGDCYRFGEPIPNGVIDDCGLAPAIRFHCRVNGIPDEISIFGCLCCDPQGNTRYQWSRPHWSVNESRRAPSR
jgi:hypothetical protein